MHLTYLECSRGSDVPRGLPVFSPCNIGTTRNCIFLTLLMSLADLPLLLSTMTSFGLSVCQVSESRSRAGLSGNNVAQYMCAQFVPMIHGAVMATSNNRGKETEKAATAKVLLF